MPEVSQWELDHLEETSKEYYKLLKQWNQLKDALMPLLMEIMMDMKDTSEWVEETVRLAHESPDVAK